ncbi:hypothetical protein H4W31_003897 [Plantactinospora soyae]|uniref:Uncharacterized protein n=1 Tax=Plantactinospora soyae TaxID=1544732 RepID=A0A927M5B4_9ACTN|nr:hypothetical protein [Plantactinospora soyae]MBE1488259.1 hypothetical protein [Plantactinospora soyae]
MTIIRRPSQRIELGGVIQLLHRIDERLPRHVLTLGQVGCRVAEPGVVDEMPRQDRRESLGKVPPPSRLVRVGLHDVDVVADGIGVDLAQRVRGDVPAHLADPEERHPRIGEPSDAPKAYEIPRPVLLVSVVPALRLFDQTETVVPNGVHRRADEFRERTCAPAHVVSFPRSSRTPYRRVQMEQVGMLAGSLRSMR